MTKNLTVLDHPLLNIKLGLLRDKNTSTADYRRIMKEIALVVAYPLTQNLRTKKKTIETPLETFDAVTYEIDPCIVSILRAGNGFLDGLCEVIPTAKIGFVGMERDHDTAEASTYYCKLPNRLSERQVFVVDPMLATGGSAIDAITKIKQEGARDITFLALVSAPEGVEALTKAHTDVKIITIALDRQLNEQKYICPGLGDAGDRYYGT